jgi:L,D-transpeptidase ErfK/SrfK
LGAYALELGDGYEIHGTLYPTLLGRNITHGCIRLNDEDLALTYQLINTGNRVYIY